MEENKKSNSSVIIIIILSLLIILATGYVVYTKVYLNKASNNKVEKSETVSENEAKKLYFEKIGMDGSELSFSTLKIENAKELPDKLYTDKLIIYNDVYSNTERIVMAIMKYNPIHVSGVDSPQKFLITDIKKNYEALFGTSVEIKNFTDPEIGECKVEGVNLVCDTNKANPYPDTGRIEKALFTKYYKSEKNGNDVIIYVKVVYGNAIYKDSSNEGEIHYYSDSGFKNEITELRGKDEENLLNEKYNNLMKTYKYTLKKSSTENYYIYSIEPVK